MRRAALLLLAGLAAFWGCARKEHPSVRRIGTEELRQLLAAAPPPVLLDVRTPGEFESGHLEGALHVPSHAITQRLSELEPYRERTVVVYCQSGVRSARVAATLAARGWTGVLDYTEGMAGWRKHLP